MFVTRYGDTRTEAVKCAKIAISNLEFPCRFVKSRKNPRRRGTITMTIVKRWEEATQWLTVYCGQDKKTEMITYIYPEGTCDEQPGEVHVSF